MSGDSTEELFSECDEYLSRLRLSIDMKIEKMRQIRATISHDQILDLINLSLELFSLLDTAEQYELFVYNFNKRIREKKNTLASISNTLKEKAKPVQNGQASEVELVNQGTHYSNINVATREETRPSEMNTPENRNDLNDPVIDLVDPTLSGNSLTEAYYKTGLQSLIENDPKLRGLPLRCAAVSKLCELRIKADNFLGSMSAEEVETCARTKHVHLKSRLPGLPQSDQVQLPRLELQEEVDVTIASATANSLKITV